MKFWKVNCGLIGCICSCVGRFVFRVFFFGASGVGFGLLVLVWLI